MYDLIIIGGGPAGYNASERAAHAGMKTLVIEEKALGGVCLNEGCIPTKTLLYSAKIYDYAKHSADYGVNFQGASIDHAKVVERKEKVIKMLVGGVGAKLKKAGVDVVYGKAMIKSKSKDGFTVEADGKEYNSTKLLICTGSDPALPPIDGLKDSLANGFAMTNRETLALKEIPQTLVVVGGGVIGLEMASYFNSVGSKIYVLEMLDHIAGPTEREISDMLKKEYEKKGINFILGAKVTSIKDGKVSYELDGKALSIEADKALVSIGRRARTQGIGLENIGVITERGAIVTDDYCRTSVPGVWAAGDVNGKVMLAHTGYKEGEVAVANMLGGKDRVNYSSIPSVIYTNPEVASVGETTESAKAKGLDVEIKTVTLKLSGRYIAENEGGNGILKILIDKKHRNVVGLHMIGNYASEIIYGAAIMVETQMRVTDIQKLVFPHPTVSEVIREAMF
ncbi:MAG: dihydrolipoyl dehydrogenase [Ruminococcaceae bacterium]|nr:dihydrolipoyl dehydrogenase [Oscillospiraceae bacterium]